MSKIHVRKQYDLEYKSSDYFTKSGGESVTQQHLKDKCDVNNIMRRYMKTGVIDHIKQNKAFYGDVTGLDYRDAHEKVLRAQEAFNALPAKLRRMMDNDPQNFLDWMSSDKDIEMKKELGLIEIPQEPAKPPKTQVREQQSEAVADLNISSGKTPPGKQSA